MRQTSNNVMLVLGLRILIDRSWCQVAVIYNLLRSFPICSRSPDGSIVDNVM